MFEFYCLKKELFDKYANDLFSILFENMNQIAPTGNSYKEDYQFWFQYMKEELAKMNQYLIVVCQAELSEIVGYFQYSVHGNILLMEEIQIKKEYQGKYNIFKRIYAFVFDNLKENIDYVEAYANKKNAKSIGILGKLGLSTVGENKRGTSYHFRGTYADLLNWYRGN